MRVILLTTIAGAIAVTGAPGVAQDQQGNSAATATPKAEKKVCRWSGTTGSYRRERICLTASQWRKVNEHLAKEAD